MESIKHLDLFSGIGGFALAAEMVWPEVEHVFCDNDPFAQAILKKHWPNSLIYGDIKELTAEQIASDTEGRWEWKREQEGVGTKESKISIGDGNRIAIDLLTGGFPCQPFSSAGRRRGTEDDRHLWPEMLRVIRETTPRFVLGENVGGFLTWDGGLVFEQVCTDLEEAGYEVCPLVIPAAAVNAPHRRDRVWIAAKLTNAASERFRGGSKDRSAVEPSVHSAGVQSDALPEDAKRIRRGGRCNGNTTRNDREVQIAGHSSGNNWRSEDWPAAAARLCALDDGIPGRLARPRGWRNAALKGAGNAIVPQVAAEILKAMKRCA